MQLPWQYGQGVHYVDYFAGIHFKYLFYMNNFNKYFLRSIPAI